MVNVKNLILGAIIAVIFVMFCAYGTNLVYESPDYEDYCNATYSPTKIATEECEISESLQQKTEACWNNKGEAIPVYDEQGCQIDIICSTCRLDYEKAEEIYSKNMFIISLIVGVIFIAISALLIQIASVSGGLMLGSLFFIVYGTARYWRFMNDWLRFILLGIALLILIYLGYRIARREK